MGLKITIHELCPRCGKRDAELRGNSVWRGLHRCENPIPGPHEPPHAIPLSGVIFISAADEAATLRARIAELEKQAAESVKVPSGWISVEDGLPEYLPGKDWSANVLGLCRGRIGVFNRFFEGEGWLWGMAYYVGGGLEDAECECDDDYQVTHWMPLPAAPTKETDQ